MADKAQSRAQAGRLLEQFLAAGAVEVTPDILQPAEALLDLYGEDIRARAYVTADPLRGEMMLRPDFTVPVVQEHMANGAEPARYAYAGEVFRRQDHRGPARSNEYFQAGFEIFDRADPEAADAEVFALFSGLLSKLKLSATIGDMGLLRAAVDGLDTLPERKAALARHIWRPKRFQHLLARYSGQIEVPKARADLLTGQRSGAPWIGLRSREEMEARIAALEADAKAPPLASDAVAALNALAELRCPAVAAPAALRTLAIPALELAIVRLERRLSALAAQGIDLAALQFDASHGRSTMEYYDGFVFTFTAANPDLPPVASGGRYDALTRQLGQGREIPAVGGVIRAGLMADLEGQA
ncbi:MAG: ATP phosphoribosyltransferase regulatory subunit [Thioclava marina]|uniref:ATP phosphoribosyltransferase regulatory subunit n=1 Tax=Thioclava marina TaxID=1915077 RepID=UPI0019A93865|nr:ATP phosphoribosyltransferase regulatory subunit [Thioclava marina]MBC7144713.1 ATP phosphoribosyltransferase regulatory subunit [Thioclava marina]